MLSPSPNPTKPGYQDIPSIAKTENSSYATVLRNATTRLNAQFAQEIQRSLVGPMPVQKFLDFLPEPNSGLTMPSPRKAFNKVPTSGAEKEMTKPIADAFNSSVATGRGRKAVRRCPGIRFCDTRDNLERIDEDRHDNPKYGITGYLQEEATTKQSMPGRAQILVDFNLHDFAKDPEPDSDLSQVFILSDNLDEKQKKVATKALGQHVSYATEICARQHRNSLFSIFMTHTEARLFRWDRAGVVVSASFDYRKSPELLCKFLWRFGNATDAERGCDTTVRRASVAEEILFKSAIERHVRSQLGDDFPTLEDEYERHYETNNVVKIPVRNPTTTKNCQVGNVDGEGTVGEDETNQFAYFLVSRPVANPRSMASRGTRGYWAMDTQTENIVFLKDVWRSNTARMEKEGDILESMMGCGIPNIPTLICYGDVGDVNNPDNAGLSYITQTDLYKDADWNAFCHINFKLKSRVHYRQVVEEAGYTLEHLAGSRELLCGARDAFQALQDTYRLCGRLHRDVSSNNIILFADPDFKYGSRRGILIDWELSCVKEDREARENWRTGTWAFMSANMLTSKPKPHQHFHDVESLVYVVFYCAIFFLPWEYSEVVHQDLLRNFFDLAILEDGSLAGNSGKVTSLNPCVGTGHYFARPQGMPAWINTWLAQVLKVMVDWYYHPPLDSFEAQAGVTESLFACGDDFYASLPSNDREYHARPARNDYYDYSTMESSSGEISMSSETCGKRELSFDDNECSRKRRKIAQKLSQPRRRSRRIQERGG